MLSMFRPVNIEISSEFQYSMKRKMDFRKSSLTNISVKQQREEYSLKKEAYGTTNSDNDNNDERSEEKSEDEKKPSLIKADDIKSYDILCGRDKATFNNVGNRRFRVLVSLNIPRYEKATTKAQKASMIKYICNIFQNEVGIRFLKKHKNGEGYYELSGSEVRKKVGHALRDMSVARHELKKKRKEEIMDSLKQDFDPLLEPFPISDEPIHGSQNQNQQQRHRDQQLHVSAHLANPKTLSTDIPDLLIQQYRERQQSQHQQQLPHLQERLFDLQKQQKHLQQEQEDLLKQQQYQQELLELQIRNRRLHQEQEQQQQQMQQQIQQQLQQQNHDDGFNQFNPHFFDTI